MGLVSKVTHSWAPAASGGTGDAVVPWHAASFAANGGVIAFSGPQMAHFTHNSRSKIITNIVFLRDSVAVLELRKITNWKDW